MKFIRYWLPVFFWMAVIFVFSTKESVQISEQTLVNFLFFKTLHIIEYAVLFTFFVRALRNSSAKIRNVFLLAFIFTFWYAVTDEIHQMFVPTRQGQPRDVIIDALGAMLAWYFLKQLLPKAPKKLQLWVKNWQITS